VSGDIISWVEIYVEDMARARKFYETVLGVTLNEMTMPEGSGMTMFAFPWENNGPGAAGALVKMEPRKPGAVGTIAYFSSDDCSELDRVEKAGGKIIMPKSPAGGMGSYCIFNDTEGNSVGLYSPN
jgi:predicted enzyme related to lactoylglutathione lyase